jgi:hypothetical protein
MIEKEKAHPSIYGVERATNALSRPRLIMSLNAALGSAPSPIQLNSIPCPSAAHPGGASIQLGTRRWP